MECKFLHLVEDVTGFRRWCFSAVFTRESSYCFSAS